MCVCVCSSDDCRQFATLVVNSIVSLDCRMCLIRHLLSGENGLKSVFKREYCCENIFRSGFAQFDLLQTVSGREKKEGRKSLRI